MVLLVNISKFYFKAFSLLLWFSHRSLWGLSHSIGIDSTFLLSNDVFFFSFIKRKRENFYQIDWISENWCNKLKSQKRVVALLPSRSYYQIAPWIRVCQKIVKRDSFLIFCLLLFSFPYSVKKILCEKSEKKKKIAKIRNNE